jgi:hypothetical protein
MSGTTSGSPVRMSSLTVPSASTIRRLAGTVTTATLVRIQYPPLPVETPSDQRKHRLTSVEIRRQSSLTVYSCPRIYSGRNDHGNDALSDGDLAGGEITTTRSWSGHRRPRYST